MNNQNLLLNYCQGTLEQGSFYAMSTETPILNVMPFKRVHGNSYSWNVVDKFLNTGIRALGEEAVADEMSVGKITKEMKIMNNSCKVDRAVSIMNDLTSAKAEAQALGMKSMGNRFEAEVVTALNGYATNDEAGVVISAELSVDSLDDLIDSVDGCNFLFVNKKGHRALKKLLKEYGQAPETIDSFGKRVTAYNGIPVIVSEAMANGAVLAVKFAEDGVTGVTCNGITTYEYTQNVFDITDTELIYQICPMVRNSFGFLKLPAGTRAKK